jgi:hypothetical protein
MSLQLQSFKNLELKNKKNKNHKSFDRAKDNMYIYIILFSFLKFEI